MSRVAVSVEGLGKQYQIGHALEHTDTLREALTSALRAPRAWWRRWRQERDAQQEILWALRNLSFQVQQGEVIGIIGSNGSGKSTLLKVLSRITEPTEGRAVIEGRVGSLLEVGTGFHPELTGRENIYLNGAILGMHRHEIAARFDEIVAFAEVERFLDTPVKRYSSGMYVRLAFAVAAHLEPEILLIDEVLAVGDAAFQKKCLGKMGSVAREGRTVLFVSHDMDAILNLCPKALFLANGTTAYLGDSGEAVHHYLQSVRPLQTGVVDLRSAPGREAYEYPILTSVSTHRPDGAVASEFRTGDTIVLRVGYAVQEPIRSPYCMAHFTNDVGHRIMSVSSMHDHCDIVLERDGVLECRLHDMRLREGTYSIDLAIGRASPVSQCMDYVESATTITVQLGDYLGGGRLTDHQGVVAQKSEWSPVDTSLPVVGSVIAGPSRYAGVSWHEE